MKKHNTLVVGAALFLSACANLMAAPDAETAAMQGFWQSEGYSYLIEIKADQARFYEYSGTDCVASFSGKVSKGRIELDAGPLGKMSGSIAVTGAGDAGAGEELVIVLNSTQERRARRIAAIPEPQAKALARRGSDNARVFDALYASFDENYAFFEERKVDWKAAREECRPAAIAAKNEGELFNALKSLLARTGDGHVGLIAGLTADRNYEAGSLPAWKPEAQTFVNAVKASYLADAPAKAAGNKLAFGKLRDGGAYLCLVGMEDYASDFDTGRKALDEGLDAAFAACSASPYLVLDLRFNSGGLDAYSLQVASRFAQARSLAWTKKARSGSGWTGEKAFYVEPSAGTRWTKPFYVLTSGLTASAAESCALALAGLPGSTIVGERTRGIFSDMLIRKLPNGWYATLSNEVYFDANGNKLETAGIKPDIEVPMDLAAARQGRDPALEAIRARESAR
jgi:hypothetical protein